MINTTPQKISLDFNQNSYKAIHAKQYDDQSRSVIITCMENGQKFDIDQNLTAQIKILTPDHRAILDTLTIQDDHTLLLVLNQSMLAAAGKAAAEVRLYDNDSLISTMHFYIIIEGAVYSDDAVTASDEFNALTDVMNKALADYTYVMESAQASATAAASSASAAADSASAAGNEAEAASNSASDAAASALTASAKASESADNAGASKSYAVGTDNIFRENDAIDNAKYYWEQARLISEHLQGTLLPMGTITFSQLNSQSKKSGYMYNISDEFTTDNTFKEGAGYTFPAGTNVYYTADGYWDCLTGTMVAGVKGDAEASYRKGNVNITPGNIGLGNVNNTADSDKSVKYAASAGNADAAVSVADYGDPSRTIKIGYSGPSAAVDNLSYVAGYLSGGTQIKDVSKAVLQSWLGLGSAAYTSSGNYASSGHTHNYIPTSASCNKNWSWAGQSGQPEWLWGSNDGSNMYVWNPRNFSVNYASSAGYSSSSGSVAWDNVGGKPSSYPPSDHSHNYLSLSGGKITGPIYTEGITMKLISNSYLNLQSNGIQCRTYDDYAWSGISAASFTNQSSRRYKENIEDITDETARQLLDYRVVSYDYINKKDGQGCLGLIAEEVAEVNDYPVIRDAEGRPDKIDYTRFVPQLIKMVQLQQEEINRLKADIQQLTERQ